MAKILEIPTLESREHEFSLSKPPEDHPAGPKLETFVGFIGDAWRPRPNFPPPTIDGLAQKVSKELCPALPLAPRLFEFVEDLGISIVTHNQMWGSTQATYTYNDQISRWEIHVPPGLGLMESWSIVHELFEIIFWRFFHKVYWWKKWAIQHKNLYYPHDCAEEFAFHVVLNPMRFRSKAKKCSYNIWALERHCQTSYICCFQAITRFISLPFPCFHALLALSNEPIPKSPTLFTIDDAPYLTYTVLQKDCKKAKLKGEILTPEMLDNEIDYSNWHAVQCFQRFPMKKQKIRIPYDDIVVQARDQECMLTTTRRVAGFHTTSEVSAIIRPNQTGNQVYIQVVPLGNERDMLIHNRYESLL